MNLSREFANGEGRDYSYNNIVKEEDLSLFLRTEAKEVLYTQLKQCGINIKFFVYVNVRFNKFEENDIKTSEPWFSNESPAILYNDSEINRLLEEIFSEIQVKFDSFIQNGSGFYFDKVLGLSLVICKFQPLAGGVDNVPILPLALRNRRAIHIFGKTDKGGCFMQCIRHHLRNHKPDIELRTRTIDNPTTLEKIPTFELINNLAIYVFGTNRKGDVCVYYVSKNPKAKTVIDLLLYQNHYFYVKKLAGLVYRRTRGEKTFICRSCLCFYKSAAKLAIHKRYCENKGTVYVLPEGDRAKLEFTNYRSMIKTEHVVYFDFESYIDGTTGIHYPIAVSAKRICTNSAYNSKLFIYFGGDCVQKFLKWLDDQKYEVHNISLHHYHRLEMSQSNWIHFHKQDKCEMCGIRFDRLNTKYKDHDHLTGAFRYVLCNRCNITYASRDTKIVCVSHNGMGYDNHFLITEIAELCRKNKTRGFKSVAKNREKNMVICYGEYVFLDSYQFLPSSLSTLVNTMTVFPLIKEHFGETNYKLFTKKGIYCYEYVKSPELLQTDRLPEMGAFYDSIREKGITPAEYKHAQCVWETMKCENLLDYTRFYLEADVLLLADCFEQFRKTTKQNFDLDPTKFLSTPHLGFNSMLKFTGIKLELFQDREMLDMIRNSIRGGISTITKRYADTNDDSSQIVYLDCCNLYGYALSRSLPVGDFRWMTTEEISSFDPFALTPDSPYGFILECDLSYPTHLHSDHNDLPLAPEKISVDPTDWSPYTSSAAKTSGIPIKKGGKKLIPHLGRRQNYVLHYQNLKFYLEQGMILEKIHRGLTFTQSKWMKPFIDFNTDQRKKAKNEFETNFWKLMSNSAYGKLLQDPGRYNNIKMVSNPRRCRQLVSRPGFKRIIIYNKRFAGIEMKKDFVYLNKPIIAGFTVLELSKLHVYKFHYLYIKKLYGDQCELLFTDTDSLVYKVSDPEFDNDVYTNRQYFDLSNYSPNNPLYDASNHRLRGTFKNEFPRDPVVAFVGTRSKMYVTLHASQIEIKKAKGLPRSVVSNMKFGEYLQALQTEEKPNYYTFYAIRSNLHVLQTRKHAKKGLCPFDDKRYVLSDGINTLAHGHFKIKQLRQVQKQN